MQGIPVIQAYCRILPEGGDRCFIRNAGKALDEFGAEQFAVAGGVASNAALREGLREECEKRGVRFYHPSPVYCTDNAAMIGAAAYYDFQKGKRDGLNLNAVPNLRLGER